MPVSVTSKQRVAAVELCSNRVTRTLTSPLAVNFKALLTRLQRICRNRPGSPCNSVGTSLRMKLINSTPLSSACLAKRSMTSSTALLNSKSMISSSSFPDSTLEKSRTSFITVSRNSLDRLMISQYSLCLDESSVSQRSPAMPMMPLIRVRISSLILARKWDLASFAVASTLAALSSSDEIFHVAG